MTRHFCKAAVVVSAVLFFKCGLSAAINIGVSPDSWDAGTGANGQYSSPQFTLTNPGEPVRVNVKATNSADWYLSNLARLNAFSLKWASGLDSGNIYTDDTLMFSHVASNEAKNFSLTYYSPTYSIPNVTAAQISSVTLTAVSSYMGKEWVMNAAALPGAGEASAVGMDKAGEFHVAFSSKPYGHPAYMDWNGNAVIVSTDSVADFANSAISLAIDSKGQPHILFLAWKPESNFSAAVLKYAWRSDNIWRINTVKDDLPASDMAFSLALGADDSPRVVLYMSYGSVAQYVFLEGSQWVFENLPETFLTSPQVSMKVDSRGTAHIAYSYYSSESGVDGVAYASRSSSGEWTRKNVAAPGWAFSEITLDQQERPCVGVSGSYNPVYGTSSMFYKPGEDGAWTAHYPIPDEMAYAGGMSTAFDPNDYPRVVYEGAAGESNVLRYGQWTGVEWLTSDLAVINTSFSSAVGFDPNGNPIAGYLPANFSQDNSDSFTYATLQ